MQSICEHKLEGGKEESKEVVEWIVGEFEPRLEAIKELGAKETDEEQKPFKFKYEARERGEKLLKDMDQVEFKDNYLIKIARGLLELWLGINFVDCEEYSEGEQHLLQALKAFNEPSSQIKVRFLEYIQDVYNHLGVLYFNREHFEKGKAYLAEAERLYIIVSELK